MNNGQNIIDDALDAALEMTFPASDPIAIFIQEYERRNDATVHDQRITRASAEMLNNNA